MGWRCDLSRLGLKSKNGSFLSCLDSFSSRGLCCSRLELEFFVFLGTRTRILWLGLPFLLLQQESRAKEDVNQMPGKKPPEKQSPKNHLPQGEVCTFCFAACSATMSLKSSFSTWACCSLTCSSYFCVMAMGSSSSSSGARATSTPCDSCPPPVFRLAMACARKQEGKKNQESEKETKKIPHFSSPQRVSYR